MSGSSVKETNRHAVLKFCIWRYKWVLWTREVASLGGRKKFKCLEDELGVCLASKKGYSRRRNLWAKAERPVVTQHILGILSRVLELRCWAVRCRCKKG